MAFFDSQVWQKDSSIILCWKDSRGTEITGCPLSLELISKDLHTYCNDIYVNHIDGWLTIRPRSPQQPDSQLQQAVANILTGLGYQFSESAARRSTPPLG